MPDPDSPRGEVLVLGTWGISGAYTVGGAPAGYGPVTECQFGAVLDAAWDAGLRWIDTAPGYGGGTGITRLAAWQRAAGRSWHVVVKPGRPVAADGPYSDVSIEAITAEVSECARLLGVPSGVLLKDPPGATYADSTLRRLLDRLHSEFATVGIATHRLDLVPLLDPAPVRNAVLQMEFHLLNRFTAVRAANAARKAGWRVWAMQPLAYGFLGGRHAAMTRFPSDDWRSQMPPVVQATLAKGASVLQDWLPPELRGQPIARTALAWCLASPLVERVVVGPRSPEQLADVLSAAELATQPAVSRFVAEAHEQLLS